jgi:pimeloyl-ACP methyl ester carboxylesterase
MVMISPGVPYVGTPQPHWVDTAPNWDADLDDPEGWDLFNRKTLVEQHRRWVEFFFGEQLVEPHSTKAFEDMVEWALDSNGSVLADSEEGIEVDLPDRDAFRRSLGELGLPVLAIHGVVDACQSVSKSIELAEMTGGDLLLIEGGGHLPQAKDPVKVIRAISDFVERIAA